MRSRKLRAIALQHVAFEDLGLLSPLLDPADWNFSYCDVSTMTLDERAIHHCDLLIVLGGPVGVYESENHPFLARETRLVGRRLDKDLPTLGICLGSQIMAAALGAPVYAGGKKETGWGRVTLTEDGMKSCLSPLSADDASVLHWHGDTFDLPAGCKRLASSPLYENQAFSVGKKVLALQFHIEADPRRLPEWYVGHACELNLAGISVRSLRDQTAVVVPSLRPRADAIFGRWLSDIGFPLPGGA
jgi:GMP synthase (glutamine-hydrolysing)